MSPVVLKKKESRLLWQVLIRGIVVTDRMTKRKRAEAQDDYSALRRKVITAWKSGILVGGIRPKSRARDIMPTYLLQETELTDLARVTKKHSRSAQKRIAVPRNKHKETSSSKKTPATR